MKTPNLRLCLDGAIAELLEQLESTRDRATQESSIAAIAARRSADACRVLAEAFERTADPQLRQMLLDGVARAGHDRGLEFLMRVITDDSNLVEGALAVGALGKSENVGAGEFLGSVVAVPSHPLVRHAVEALAALPAYPSWRPLLRLLPDLARRQLWGPVEQVVAAIGCSGVHEAWPVVEATLESQGAPEAVRCAAYLTAARLGGEPAWEWLSGRASGGTRAETLALETARSLVAATSVWNVEAAATIAICDPDSARSQLATQVLARVSPLERDALIVPLESARNLPRHLALRAALATGRSWEVDFAFVDRWSKKLRGTDLALLAVAHRDSQRSYEPVDALSRAASLPERLELWRTVRHEGISHALLEIAEHHRSEHERIAAVNALVAQVQLAPVACEHRSHCVDALATLLSRPLPARLRARVLRALGQVECNSEIVLTALRASTDNDEMAPSAYYGLSLIRCQSAATILLDELHLLTSHHEPTWKVEHVLTALARSGALPGVDALEDFEPPDTRRARLAMLRILCANTVRGQAATIAQSLRSADQAERLLAVAAAGANYCDELRDGLEPLLDQEEASLALRARDSLAHSSNPEVLRRLLRDLESADVDEASAIAVLHSLRPRGQDAADDIRRAIDERLEAATGAYALPSVRSAARSTRDALSLNRIGRPADGDLRPIDQALTGQLTSFYELSESARAVLRNAELTWQRTDLFDHRVDKSTVIVEYVKAIELLLQETLGIILFVGSRRRDDRALVDALRTRVIRLGLDQDPRSATELIARLQCQRFFDEQAFPAYKMTGMCRAILKGRATRNPGRYFDGLRSWAVVLLVFGRAFEYESEALEPLLPLRDTTSDRIAALARDLNALQYARNEAAHRGTVLWVKEIEDTRKLCLHVLSELEAVMPVV